MKPLHKFQVLQRNNTSPYKPNPYQKGIKQNIVRKGSQVVRRAIGSTSNISVNQEKLNNENYKERIISLTKSNSQLQNKELKYIQKLKKLQQGLENQYVESMKLQELYEKLLDSYKIKQQQIKELQFRYQQFQESSRKRNDTDVDYQDIIDNLKNQKQILEKLFNDEKKRSLDLQIFYQQNKSIVEKHRNECQIISNTNNEMKQQENLEQKIKSLSNTRLITEFMNMQDLINNQKQQIFKLQYQNQYLKKRHHDLQAYRNQIDKIVSIKQIEIQKLRQDKISLLRNQTDRKLNSSPRDKDRLSSSRKTDQKNRNLIINQNRQLKSEVQSLKSEMISLNRLVTKQRQKIYHLQSRLDEKGEKKNRARHDDFFSFSKQQMQSKQKMDVNNANQEQQQQQQQEYQQIYQDLQKRANDLVNQENQRLMKLIEIKQTNDDLPPFPQELQIDNLIRNMDNKRSRIQAQEIEESKWEVAQK